MENFIITITFLLIGMGIKRLSGFPDQTGNVLNLFVIYISLPALVLLKSPELTFSWTIMTPAVMPWAMLVFSGLMVLLLSKILHWKRTTIGCLLLMVPLGNTSFLGIPMVQAFFGADAILYALLYDQIGSFPALAIWGSVIIAIYGRDMDTPTEYFLPVLKGIIKRMLTFPPFIALIFAVMLKQFSYPPVVITLLTVLADTLVPLVMVAVGFQLTFRLNKPMMSQIGIGLSLKMIAAPLTALLFCRMAEIHGDAMQIAVFEAGMPPMVSAGALAILANLEPELAAAMTGIGIIVSFATLPILHQMLI